MYDFCPLKYSIRPENVVGGDCPFCGKYKNDKYCGISKNPNKLSSLTKCPLKQKRGKNARR
tara:strand:+ start:1129 stop:1311 length:183 start_codon:yes stop_codon:yes gene_type:complete